MRKVELLPTRDCEAGYGPVSQTTCFPERLCSYPSDGKPFCGCGYRLDFSPTEQEPKTSILQAFSTW